MNMVWGRFSYTDDLALVGEENEYQRRSRCDSQTGPRPNAIGRIHVPSAMERIANKVDVLPFDSRSLTLCPTAPKPRAHCARSTW